MPCRKIFQQAWIDEVYAVLFLFREIATAFVPFVAYICRKSLRFFSTVQSSAPSGKPWALVQGGKRAKKAAVALATRADNLNGT